jgi:serine/threonine protein kinase
MAYQTAKGMHFLHSSGIVHRDLKSLNLLLDTKWNIKVGRLLFPSPPLCQLLTLERLQVSDFGLTKFKEELKRGHTKLGQGSIHWTAPEVIVTPADGSGRSQAIGSSNCRWCACFLGYVGAQ